MGPWRRRFYRDLLDARRAVRALAMLAARRAVESKKLRPKVKFRPLIEAEAEAIVGAELLAAAAASAGVHKS